MDSRFAIPRRSFLKGLGVALGLPWLEQMGWAAEPSGAGPAPRRMAFFYIPSGAHMADWTPKRGSAGLPWILEPLKPAASHLLVISGLRHDKANANGDGPGDHAREAGTFLTGCQVRKTSGTDIQNGISVDQVAAQRAGQLTPLPSLELGIERGGQSGDCDSGYSCAYSSNISWRSPTQPNTKETKPREVFRRLFSDARQGAGAQGQGAATALRRSVLDLVGEDAKRLRGQLGGSDQRKLDEYLDAVRALEQRVQKSGSAPVELPPAAKGLQVGEPKGFAEHVALMFDLLALAFQTDSTRIATFMYGNGGSNRSYPDLGVAGGHHEISHHGKDPAKIEAIRKINRHHVELFAAFVEKLRAIPEGKSTLLDNCMLLYGSALSDGDRHNHDDLPVILVGKGGGTIQSGRHIPQAKGNMCDLFLAMLARFGTPVPSIGDSQKMLPDL